VGRRVGVLIVAGGKPSRLLPPLLPLIGMLFFVWNAERSHERFLERVPERDRAFFSRGTRPLLFFTPLLLLPGGFFVVTAVTTLRQTRLRSTPEQVTLSSALLGVEFNQRSFARPGVQGVRLKRVGPDMPSYTLRTPASPKARREAENRLAYPSDALLVTASGERALVRNLTPEEGQWLRGALREMQLTEIVDRSRDSERSRDSPEIPVPMPRGKEAERLNRLEGTSQSTNRREDQSLSERWTIEGFDCQFPEPDVVVFQPNERRSRESVAGLVVLVVFLSVWAAGPMFFWLNAVGLLHSKIEPPFPTDWPSRLLYGCLIGVFAWGPTAVILLALYLYLHDDVLHRNTAITLDRRRDRVLFGRREICAISQIRSLTLRQIIPARQTPEARSKYGVSLQLRNGRTVPRKLFPGQHLRYGLGEQDESVVNVLSEVAAFLGVEFHRRSEAQQVAPRGM
jgi:hypothetical protein